MGTSVNSEIGVKLICADIGEFGKMPTFLWRQKPTLKSIRPAAEYIEFDRHLNVFSFNSDKLKKNISVAASENEWGWSVARRIFILVSITAFVGLYCYLFILCFFCRTGLFGIFTSLLQMKPIWGWAIFMIAFIAICGLALAISGIVFGSMIIFSLFENLAKILKLKNVERNVFSGAKYYLKVGNKFEIN